MNNKQWNGSVGGELLGIASVNVMKAKRKASVGKEHSHTLSRHRGPKFSGAPTASFQRHVHVWMVSDLLGAVAFATAGMMMAMRAVTLAATIHTTVVHLIILLFVLLPVQFDTKSESQLLP
jgi:hypothetical protein